jgi:hypothetical protein
MHQVPPSNPRHVIILKQRKYIIVFFETGSTFQSTRTEKPNQVLAWRGTAVSKETAEQKHRAVRFAEKSWLKILFADLL